MKKLNKILLSIFASALFLTSCSNDDNSGSNESLGAYDNGIFVLNEGNTTTSTSWLRKFAFQAQSDSEIYL